MIWEYEGRREDSFGYIIKHKKSPDFRIVPENQGLFSESYRKYMENIKGACYTYNVTAPIPGTERGCILRKSCCLLSSLLRLV